MAMQVRHARRLAAVKKMILDEPRRFNMSSWALESKEAPCGTAACIAGFVVWRAHGMAAIQGYIKCTNTLSISDRAIELLGGGRHMLSTLFHLEYWPEDLEAAYDKARDRGDHEAMAEVACRRIDAFLADRGFGPDGERLPKEPASESSAA